MSKSKSVPQKPGGKQSTNDAISTETEVAMPKSKFHELITVHNDRHKHNKNKIVELDAKLHFEKEKVSTCMTALRSYKEKLNVIKDENDRMKSKQKRSNVDITDTVFDIDKYNKEIEEGVKQYMQEHAYELEEFKLSLEKL
jgi:cupin superfamily acireductone dioxygenase involved in methionine salvage